MQEKRNNKTLEIVKKSVSTTADPLERAARALDAFRNNLEIGWAFLGTDAIWRRELQNRVEPPTPNMVLYGPMKSIGDAEKAMEVGELGVRQADDTVQLHGLIIKTPTQDPVLREVLLTQYTEQEANDLRESTITHS